MLIISRGSQIDYDLGKASRLVGLAENLNPSGGKWIMQSHIPHADGSTLLESEIRPRVTEDQIGGRIRRIRRQHDMSLTELSTQVGVSRSLISQIELGRTNPSLPVLRMIAKALSVPLFTLFVEDGVGGSLVRRDSRPTLQLPGSDIVRELLVPDLSRRMTLLSAQFGVGDQSSYEPSTHEGEECILVTRGRIEVQYHLSVIELNEGDSFYFDSTVPHLFANKGSERAEIVVAICGTNGIH